MLNTKIKPFNNIAYYKNNFYNINNYNFKNKWNILFFFPFAFSFVCPIELKTISSYKKKFKKNNCNIYAISTDSHFTHKKWTNELKFINFPFISDFNNILTKNFNIYNKNDGNSERATFIIDKNLVIRYINIIDSSIGRSIKTIYNSLILLKYTNKNNQVVCPYNWIKDKKDILTTNY